MPEQMKAAVLVEAQKIEVRDVTMPRPLPHQVLVRTTGVGICGTDLHIYGGQANYNRDATGKPIPLREQPQILGHEISGVIEEIGAEVRDLNLGERVILDQGLNCYSLGIEPVCEFCASGDSHQCLHYQEHGITGVPGGFAQYVAIAAVNAIRVEGDLPRREVALAESFGCVIHAAEFTERAGGRYTLGGERRARNVLILGAGPAGLFFLQYYRQIYGFDGNLFVADLNPHKLKLAESFGATVLNTTGEELVKEVIERTKGEKIHLLIEATGAGAVFQFLPGLLRKQATVVLYGHGHEGADMSLLNYLQFIEPTLVSPVGASGSFDPDRRSKTYRNSIRHLVEGRVKAAPLITDPCDLNSLPRIFAKETSRPDFIKAVLEP